MKRGTGKHPVTPGSVVNIRTDAEFTVYAIEKGVRTSILGPDHSTERQIKLHIPGWLHQIEVTTRKSGRWILTETVRPTHKEKINNTKVEIGVREEHDPQAEMVQQITEQILSKLADKEGHETIEEADDFNVEDEFDPTSQYELSEMQEEAEPEPAPPIEEAPVTPAPGEGSGTSDPTGSPPEPSPAPPAATSPPPSAG